MVTLGQDQLLPVLTHPGWIPKTDWEELEDLRDRLLEQLETPYSTEASVVREYAAKEKQYQRELKEAMHRRENNSPRGEYLGPISDRDLVPSENQLANARAEHMSWIAALIAIGEEVKTLVEDNAVDWKASLGDVEGLALFTRQTQEVVRFLQGAQQRYGHIVPDRVFAQTIKLVNTLPVEAYRINRLWQWLDRVESQPIFLTFTFYEDRDNVPDFSGYDDEEDDDDSA